ncbi:MAG: DNA polymerase Y family protein [Burkholderiaceae bacterium]
MLWIGIHLPALSLESFIATLAPEPPPEAQVIDDLDEIDAVGPVALIDRHRIVAANAAARDCGVRPGQKRATALALAPHTRLGEADPARDAAALMAVAHVAMGFTPAVSFGGDHVVLAEVQASLRYFGGLPRLLQRLRAELAPLGHALRVACAPTAQGAQWMAVGGAEAMPEPALANSKADWRARIGAVPVTRMAAAAPHLGALEALGLTNAASLWKQPRAGLVRRFGGELLADIDRALGELADPRTALQPAPTFDSRLELFMRADDSAALLTGAAVLLNRLTAWATAHRGLVAGFELRLHHESCRKMLEDPTSRTTVLEIGLGEPVSDTAHLHSLLRERLQRLPLAASVIELSLHCHAITPGAPPNTELFPSAASVGEGWHRLLERFEARLGAHNIQRLQALADHRPELATTVREGGDTSPARERTHGAPLNLATSTGPSATASGDPAHWPRLKRPVWLLRQPQPLRDEGGTPLLSGRPLWLVAGPERIEAGWWDGGYAARDYFIAQDHEGALLWVYRFRRAPEVGAVGWYLQGKFG